MNLKMETKKVPIDNHIRESIINTQGKNFLVEASAGTGKTTLIVEKILNLLETQRIDLTKIVAITFTEKAGNELKIRIREKLEEKLNTLKGSDREYYEKIFLQLPQAPIGTIHSFALNLIRQLPISAKIDIDVEVLDAFDELQLFDQCWQEWFENQLAENKIELLIYRCLIENVLELNKIKTLAFIVYNKFHILKDFPITESLDNFKFPDTNAFREVLKTSINIFDK